MHNRNIPQKLLLAGIVILASPWMLLCVGCINSTTAATLAITPSSATLVAGQQQQFTVNAPAGVAINWVVNGVAGGSATAGTITSAGLYTAPSNIMKQETVSVGATTSGTALQLVATVTINPATSTTPTANITVSPLTIPSGANATLTWSSLNVTSCTINGLSTIDGVTVGTAGSTPVSVLQTTPYQFNCTGPNGSATSLATLTVQATAGISVSITPTTGTLASAGTMQFSATVTNDPSGDGVFWTSSLGSTPVANGLFGATYTAPSVTQNTTVNVTAISVANPNVSAIATITITPPGGGGGGGTGGCTSAPPSQNPPQASIQPALVQINVGTTTPLPQTFIATLSGDNATSQGFTWSINPAANTNPAYVGTITPTSPNSNTAVYQAAGVTTLVVVQLIATSTEYTCIHAYATVQIVPSQ